MMTRATWLVAALALAAGLGLVACREQALMGGLGGAARGPADKAGGGNGGDGRPTDQGEGVEGFLTDPQSITLAKSGGAVTVQGPKGEVAAANGSPGAVTVALWDADKAGIGQAATATASLSVKATLLACGTASGDGSFTLQTKRAVAGTIAVSAGTNCQARELQVLAGASTVGIAVDPSGTEHGFVPLTLGAAQGAPLTQSPQFLQSLTLPPLGDPRIMTAITCPNGGTAENGIANCGGNQCDGLQIICANTHTATGPADGTRAIVGVKVVGDPGAHAAAPSCPDGYRSLGAFGDCGGGQCSGTQTLCVDDVQYSQIPAGTPLVTSFFVSALGAHTATPSCPGTWQVVGTIADCGTGPFNTFGNACNGWQHLCVTYAAKP